MSCLTDTKVSVVCSESVSSEADSRILVSPIDEDPDSEEDLITFDGTIRWCEDMSQNPEDVVFLAVAYELKSPSMATWTRQGWVDGWKSLG